MTSPQPAQGVDWREFGESVMVMQGPEAVRAKIRVFKQLYPDDAVRAFEAGARDMGYEMENELWKNQQRNSK